MVTAALLGMLVMIVWDISEIDDRRREFTALVIQDEIIE